MNVIRTRLHVAEDGAITGRAPGALRAGEHDAEIVVQPAANAVSMPAESELWANIRALQDEVAQLPVLDLRTPDEILGYNASGTFD